MVHLLFVFVLFSLCSAALGPVRVVPSAWKPSHHHTRSSVEGSEVKVTVALTQRNLDVLEDRFWAVSDPTNPNYGKYMSFSELTDLVTPEQSAIDAVTNWFVSSGIPSDKIELHEARDIMFVTMTVPQMQSIFQTSVTSYVHKRTGTVATHMDSYVIPEHVSAYVDYVSDLNSLRNVPRVAPEIKAAKKLRPPAQAVPVPGKFEVPEDSGLRAARVVSNAPLMRRQVGGDNSINWEGIILCPDGTTPPPSLICSGGVSLTKIFIALYNNITGSGLLLSTTPESACYLCSDLGTYCTEWATAAGVSTSSMYCGVGLGSSFVTNYVPYNMHIWVQYSNSQNSSSMLTNAIEASVPVTPQVIWSTYGIPSSTVVTNTHNNQSIAAFNGETFLKSDLQTYFTQNGITDYSNLASTYAPANMQSQATDEASLDMQTIMGVARNCKTRFWDMSMADSNDFPYSWIHQVLASSDAPLVHSVSYGIAENAIDFARSNTEFMKAGVRGITVIVSSGDDGVYSTDSSQFHLGYSPNFPASSPYVTTLGATMLWGKTDPSCYDIQGHYTCTGTTEVVATPALGAIIASGGGFSNQFARPSYQDSVIGAYLTTLPAAKYPINRTSRAYPDVSALGHNVPIFVNNAAATLDGTSASSPFFAAFVTLLNDIRLNNGMPPLGFLNPFIYSLPSNAFNDVTIGSNDCSTDICPGPAGFPAQPGYDAATGLGSPVWSVWASHVLTATTSSSSTATSATTASTATTNAATTTATSSTTGTTKAATTTATSSTTATTKATTTAATSTATTATSATTQSTSASTATSASTSTHSTTSSTSPTSSASSTSTSTSPTSISTSTSTSSPIVSTSSGASHVGFSVCVALAGLLVLIVQ